MPNVVTVTYIAVDTLPGGLPALFAARDGHLDVLMSRTATVDEIAAAFGPMYQGMAEWAMHLEVGEVA